MTDDWNLKDKKIAVIHYSNTDGLNITINFPDFAEVFPSKEIDILHQKLIEDVDSLRTDLFTGRNWKTVVKSIINKRFGRKA